MQQLKTWTREKRGVLKNFSRLASFTAPSFAGYYCGKLIGNRLELDWWTLTRIVLFVFLTVLLAAFVARLPNRMASWVTYPVVILIAALFWAVAGLLVAIL